MIWNSPEGGQPPGGYLCEIIFGDEPCLTYLESRHGEPQYETETGSAGKHVFRLLGQTFSVFRIDSQPLYQLQVNDA
eukprot:281058-Karenia_brevis.AAC.1